MKPRLTVLDHRRTDSQILQELWDVAGEAWFIPESWLQPIFEVSRTAAKHWVASAHIPTSTVDLRTRSESVVLGTAVERWVLEWQPHGGNEVPKTALDRVARLREVGSRGWFVPASWIADVADVSRPTAYKWLDSRRLGSIVLWTRGESDRDLQVTYGSDLLKFLNSRKRRSNGGRKRSRRRRIRADVPQMISDSGPNARAAFKELLDDIPNPNTRDAYLPAITGFLDWCQEEGYTLVAINSNSVATYRQTELATYARETVRQRLTAIQKLLTALAARDVLPECPGFTVSDFLRLTDCRG